MWYVWQSGYTTYSSGMQYCYGIRPIIKMNDGVYVVSGDGTEDNPYVLGK